MIQVVVHIRDNPLYMVLLGLNSRVCGAEPVLLIGIKPQVLMYLKNVFHTSRQTLAVPTLNGHVPPHGPFPYRQAINLFKIHCGSESFHMIHRLLLISERRRSESTGPSADEYDGMATSLQKKSVFEKAHFQRFMVCGFFSRGM
jgi:hypothetical protein